MPDERCEPHKPVSILVVDDSPDALDLIRRHLEPLGHRVYTVSGVREGVELLENAAVDLVITDLKMPEIGGMELVRHVRENFKATCVMMVTGYPTIDSAVESVKLGADEYLAKPFTKKELLDAVENVLKIRRERGFESAGDDAVATAPDGMIGRSSAMAKVFSAIEKAAKVKATVLITGESGTGKELVARAIHYRSPRASHAFVPVNCGGIPETLLESELFGHLKGAFTGASESRAGFFQTADKGTIFLDEVSETGVAMQVKLLRVLQEKEVCMVGSSKSQPVDVRIIAGTNKNLANLIQVGRFREDLYYRLNVIDICLPPLRERGDDALLLVRHFSEKYAEEMGRDVPEYTDRSLDMLKKYAWPGNVRELENLVQRLMAMVDGDVIDSPDLPETMRGQGLLQNTYLDRTLAEVEVEYVRRVLEHVRGNKTKAAEILGIDRKTLREKIKKR